MTPVRFYRFLPWWMLVLAAAAVIAWQYRVELISATVDAFLATQDSGDWEVEPSKINWDRLELARVGFETAVAGSRHRILATEVAVDLSYDRGPVPAIDKVYIKDLQVTQTSPATSSSTPLSAGELQRLLLDALQSLDRRALPPIRTLAVDNIRYQPLTDTVISEAKTVMVSARDDGVVASALVHGLPVSLRWQASQIDGSIKSAEDSVDAALAFELDWNDDALSLNGSIQPNTLVSLVRDRWPDFKLLDPLSDIIGEMDFQLVSRGGDKSDELNLAATLRSGDLRWHEASMQDFDFSVDLPLEQSFVPGEDPLDILLGPGRATFAMSRMNHGGAAVTGWRFQPIGRLALGQDSVSLNLASDSTLSARSLSTADGPTVENLQVEVRDELTLAIRSPNNWTFKTNGVSLSGSFSDGEGAEISGLFVVSSTEFSNSKSEMTVQWLNPAIQLPELRDMPNPTEARVTLRRTVGTWDFSGDASFDQFELGLLFDGQFHSETDELTANFKTVEPVSAAGLLDLVNQSGAARITELQIARGLASLEGSLAGSLDAPRIGLGLDVVDLDARFGNYEIVGLNLDGHWQVLPNLTSTRPSRLRINKVQYGVELTNLAASIVNQPSPAGPLPGIRIPWFRAELFAGRISGGPLSLDLNNPEADFALHVENLDIARIVETQSVDGLKATGNISGTLPVSLNRDGLRIRDGTLQGGAPGTINYDISEDQAAAMSNPLTDVVIDALRDFRYEILQAEANYQHDGTLNLDFHIEGTSPRLESNRPVHLNINTEQNVLSLLQSLDYAEGLNESLDRRIREQYE